jgi:hypothetical protein
VTNPSSDVDSAGVEGRSFRLTLETLEGSVDQDGWFRPKATGSGGGTAVADRWVSDFQTTPDDRAGTGLRPTTLQEQTGILWLWLETSSGTWGRGGFRQDPQGPARGYRWVSDFFNLRQEA